MEPTICQWSNRKTDADVADEACLSSDVLEEGSDWPVASCRRRNRGRESKSVFRIKKRDGFAENLLAGAKKGRAKVDSFRAKSDG